MKGEIIPIKYKEQKEAEAYRAENREFQKQAFLKCIATINKALCDTGEDQNILAHLFLHFSMVLCDGSFNDLLNMRYGVKETVK